MNKKESISLKELKLRYNKAVKFDLDISIKGIKLTKDVIEFIKEKRLQGLKYNNFNNCYYVTDRLLLTNKIIIKPGNIQTGIVLGTDKEHIFFSYNPLFNEIILGRPDMELFNSEEEFLTYINEAYIHEFLHSLLDKMFNSIVSNLFDLVEENFRESNILIKLIHRANKKYNCRMLTHKQAENSEGKGRLREYYHITKTEVNQAYILASKRLKQEA